MRDTSPLFFQLSERDCDAATREFVNFQALDNRVFAIGAGDRVAEHDILGNSVGAIRRDSHGYPAIPSAKCPVPYMVDGGVGR